MIDPIRQRIEVILFVLLCSFGTMHSLAVIRDMGNDLSDVDPFSEANVLREVQNFREHGLMRDHGLGNVYHPDMYPGQGFTQGSDDANVSVTPEGVYTHYPPGPEYLLYAASSIFGPEPVSRLRLLPITAGWIATLFLGFKVRRRFGIAVGWLVMSAFLLAPATYDGFIGLQTQGYALALLMVEIGCAIGALPSLAPFAIVGFLQGWLSFDYVFLVTFVPLALEAVLPRMDPGYRPRWRLALMRAVLAGGGFTAALALHFLQVWAWWGTFDTALRDFAAAASHRAGMSEGTTGYLTQALGNLKTYLYGLHPFHLALSLPDSGSVQDWSMFRFLGLSLGPWWLLVTLGMIAWHRFNPKPGLSSSRLDWHFVCAIGMLTSSLWFIVMVNHGGYHRHFIYRHLFFAFFVMVLFSAIKVSRLYRRERAVGPGLALDMAPILTRSRSRDATQETGHEIRHLL
jgi:hypothetical protein